MAANVSENEETETETNKTNKVSDSGYSNSCSNNSQSQRSNSSKSRHSISSGSSGYCGHPSTLNNSVNEENNTKKKSKLQVTSSTTSGRANDDDTSFTPPNPADAVIVKKPTPRCVDPAVLDNMSAPTAESEALQVAVLAQTLFCIQTNTSVQPLDDHDMLSPPAPANNEPHSAEMVLSVLKDELKHDKEFCVVVSLSDGSVVYSTPSLTNVLGFPKDMWIGRSLINFMHPKDRIAFASHITSAMAQSHFKQKETMIVEESDKIEDTEYFYCWIRLYNGLKTSGFNVSDKNPAYLPCQLSMSFKEVPDQGVLLVATARIVKSAYKVTDEIRTNPPTFTTRHTANTLISHVDDDVVTHFGYLPHDMIGRSIFDFYYSEDLPYLKDVYRQVVTEEGPLFLSRPYKFRCQNGDYVMVETEWSSFINPWGKKLEFIIGRHKVLTGPQNADVVRPVLEPEVISNNEEDLIGSKVFQEEIKVLLTEPIVRCYEPSQQQLAQLVESLEKISNSQLQDQSTDVRVPSATSEMLGEISPHHVYSDSKSSSETPPSYTQLTYNENIHRFFASEPKTAGVDGSRDPKIEPNLSSSSGGEEEKSMLNNSSFNSNSNSCLNREGSGQSSDPSSNSPAHNRSKHEISGDEKKKPFNDHYNTKPLTEEMLYQHNENMNKQMAQKHKKDKTKSQVNRKHKRMQLKNHKVNDQEDQGAHGMKRSVSNSWQGEPMKVFKGVHQEQPASNVRNHLLQEASNIPRPLHTLYSAQPIAGHMNYASPLVNPIMQLPCVYMNPLPPAPAVCLHENRVPVNRNLADEHRPDGPGLDIHRPPLHVPAAPYVTHQVQYMPSLMYQLPLLPMVYTQSHIVPPTVKPRMTYMPNINLTTLPQQQTWRATSVKEEPGSALCSFASASLKQALSVSSKKENKSRTSSPVYSPDLTSNTGKTKTGTFDNDLTHDDTSFCSYSSLFPKTEKSDDSMKDSEDKENNGQFKTWRNNSSPENNAHKKIRKEPTWMENVEVSEELMLRYQLEGCILSKVLQSDFETLLKFNQPEMVNEQLDQLYVDLEGLSKQLTLEESFPSSGSSGDERNLAIAGMPSTSSSTPPKTKKKRKFMGHDKCAMIFEEDAPMPPSSAELIAIAAESS